MKTIHSTELARNKEVAELYVHKLWEEHNSNVIDDLVHENVTVHTLFGDFHGRVPLKKVVEGWLIGFPDLKVINDRIIAENDIVCVQWHAKGTHRGEFKGRQPTDKRVAYGGTTIYRIKDGLIVEYWAYIDMQHLLNQL